MGRELPCRAKSAGKWMRGKALLETNEILFCGDQRLKIPIPELTSAIARDGKLHLKWAAGNSAVFELGEQAEKWAHAILHPKSTAEKLGVKPGLRVSALHMPDDEVMKDARKAAAEFSEDKPLRDADMIFLSADSGADLTRMKKLIPSLSSNGALWIVYPKGKKEITELQVLNAGRTAGLYDVKVVSYSASHTALKFVRPRDKR
jgi:hypothetical protein